MTANKTFVYKKVPAGLPVAGQDLAVETREIDLDAVPKGGFVVEELYASFDPYQRGRMRDPAIKSYTPPYTIDGPIGNTTVSRVLKSDHPDYKEGDLVSVLAPIAQYAAIADPAAFRAKKLDNPYDLDPALFTGPLGMSGLTAWSSLYKIGQPKKGETIFVSSAAGSVGQIVGQIAKKEGLRVIGSVGSDEKVDFVTKELGFDAAFNYKTETPADGLRRLAPDGIDIYYENVGGDHLEAALDAINVRGRIIVCGMISKYNPKPGEVEIGIRNLGNLISKQLLMQGFLVNTPGFGPDYTQEHQEKLQKWLADGTFKAKLAITEGIENAAEGFIGMLEGKNFGKAVLKIKA